MKKFLFLIVLVFSLASEASAQDWSVATNLFDYVSLGTINAEASAAAGRHLSVNASARVNPWTFHQGDPAKQMQNRHQTYAVGIRYWPWHIYSGWWFSGMAQYQEYNRGGIIAQETEEGDGYTQCPRQGQRGAPAVTLGEDGCQDGAQPSSQVHAG